MKKVFSIGLVLIGLLFISSCEKRQLTGPTKLDYDNESFLLRWNKSEKAQKYLLILNDEEIIVNANQFSLRDYPQDVYKAKVKAKFANSESVFSNEFAFFLKKENILTYRNNAIFWEKFQAASYDINVIENEKIVDQVKRTKNNFIQIKQSYTNSIYTYEVKMYVSGKLINSDKLIYNSVIKTYYKEDQDLIFTISNVKKVFIDYELINEGVQILTEQVIIEKELLNTFENEVVSINLVAEEAVVYFYNITTPPVELVSSREGSYQNSDVSFQFNLNGYDFVAGDEKLEEADFSFFDSVLIIKKEWFENFISNHPEARFVGLAFAFEKDQETYVVNLWVRLSE